MKQINLNHQVKYHEFNAYALGLLVLGIFCASAVFLYHYQIVSQSQSLISKMQQQKEIDAKGRKEARSLDLTKQAGKAEYKEVTIVNQAIQQLVLPWVGLFKGLESVDRPDIKLLALEPNVQKKAVNIKAVAADTNSMMSYIDSLSEKKIFKKVTLISQSSKDVNGSAMIAFELEAKWII